MTARFDASRSRILPIAGTAVLVAAIVGVGLWLGVDGDDDGGGDDPYRNAVSDDGVPEIAVTVRDDGGQPVADLAYTAKAGPIPDRGTAVYLQTLDDDTWSTAYTLSTNGIGEEEEHVVEGVVTELSADAAGGLGPDTYPLPDLNADDTYRICVPFVVGGTGATGCSAPFHNS